MGFFCLLRASLSFFHSCIYTYSQTLLQYYTTCHSEFLLYTSQLNLDSVCLTELLSLLMVSPLPPPPPSFYMWHHSPSSLLSQLLSIHSTHIYWVATYQGLCKRLKTQELRSEQSRNTSSFILLLYYLERGTWTPPFCLSLISKVP